MSLEQPRRLLAASIAVGTVLLVLWLEGGFTLALLGAALADLSLTLFERRRMRNADPVEVTAKDS